jgi:hypothetical protein
MRVLETEDDRRAYIPLGSVKYIEETTGSTRSATRQLSLEQIPQASSP